MNGFLPVSREDMEKRGWEQPDFVYVTGDAYVDHPPSGPPSSAGFWRRRATRWPCFPSPDWKDEDSVRVFGRPRLAFLISGGNMDSMVNHYSVSKHRRKQDSYTPGGVYGKAARQGGDRLLQPDPEGV